MRVGGMYISLNGSKIDQAIHWKNNTLKITSMKQLSVAIAVAIITVPLIATADDSPDADFKMRPIGHVQKTENRTVIVLEKEYEPGLLGLDGFSHIYVVWWFSQNDSPE